MTELTPAARRQRENAPVKHGLYIRATSGLKLRRRSSPHAPTTRTAGGTALARRNGDDVLVGESKDRVRDRHDDQCDDEPDRLNSAPQILESLCHVTSARTDRRGSRTEAAFPRSMSFGRSR